MSWVQYEDSNIYDGWILEYNPETKEIKWRNFYITNRLTKKQKREIENKIIKILTT